MKLTLSKTKPARTVQDDPAYLTEAAKLDRLAMRRDFVARRLVDLREEMQVATNSNALAEALLAGESFDEADANLPEAEYRRLRREHAALEIAVARQESICALAKRRAEQAILEEARPEDKRHCRRVVEAAEELRTAIRDLQNFRRGLNLSVADDKGGFGLPDLVVSVFGEDWRGEAMLDTILKDTREYIAK